MRKPRDYDAEMKRLTDKARQLKARKQSQMGELVMACGADRLGIEELAGALLAAVATSDAATKAGWRKRGAAFFQGAGPGMDGSAPAKPGGAATDGDGVQPAARSTGPA